MANDPSLLFITALSSYSSLSFLLVRRLTVLSFILHPFYPFNIHIPSINVFFSCILSFLFLATLSFLIATNLYYIAVCHDVVYKVINFVILGSMESVVAINGVL